MSKTDKNKWKRTHTLEIRRNPEKEMKDFFENEGIMVFCAKIHPQDFQGFETYLITKSV